MNTLSYEKAKELKDSGFPQEAVYGTAFYNEQAVRLVIDENLEGLHWPQYMRCPTLSELIQACGESFYCLFSQHIVERDRDKPAYCAMTVKIMNGNIGTGPTPEEAVAALWLALNKK